MGYLGQQKSIIDAAGTLYFNYSDTMQLTAETNSLGTLTRTYDSLGRSSSLTLGRASSSILRASLTTEDRPSEPDYIINYNYDSYGRFHSVSSSVFSVSSACPPDFPRQRNVGWVVNYSYLQNSSLIFGWSNDTFIVMKTYETNRNLITGIENKGGTNLISQFSYLNDAIRLCASLTTPRQVGRRTQRVDTLSTMSTNLFDYNVRSELTNAVMADNTYNYDYDPIGNRKSVVRDQDSVVSTLSNPLNQYTNITCSVGSVSQSPQYDFDGNMTYMPVSGGDGWYLQWNAENRLILATNSNYAFAFAYDYMGRRISKTTINRSLGTTNRTLFVYDGWNLIAESRTAYGSEPACTNYYTWGLDLSGTLQGAGGIGGLLSMTHQTASETNIYFSVCDANGNISDYVDTNGTIRAHFGYTPFGKDIYSEMYGDKTAIFSFGFSSKYLDWEYGLNLYYYGYRFYSSELGRWINRDPIHEQGGLNLYGFVQNNPVLYIDQYGLVHWRTFAHGALQSASGLMMWVVGGTAEIGTGGMATPVALGLGLWGSANIASGINALSAAFDDKGPPDPVQVQIVEQIYETIAGEPMGPTGQQITRSAVYTIDIVCACYTINISWRTMMEQGTIWQMYPEIPMQTPAGVEVLKVGSQLQFYGHVTGSGMQATQVGIDYYGLWNSTYDLSSGAWELIFEEIEFESENGGN